MELGIEAGEWRWKEKLGSGVEKRCWGVELGREAREWSWEEKLGSGVRERSL